jgi:transposase InsO family protein
MILPCNPATGDECLNQHWFTSLAHARVVIESWRFEYNEEKPKKGLGVLTPPAMQSNWPARRLQ